MFKPLVSIYLIASAIVTLGNASAFLLQLFLVRAPTPSDFGACNVILALSNTLVAPIAVLPLIVSKIMIEQDGDTGKIAFYVRRIVKFALLTSAVFFIAFIAFGNSLYSAIQINDPAVRLLLPALVVSTFLFHVPLGIWQGERDYVALSFGTAAVPLLRCLAVVVLVTLLGGGLNAAIIALIFGGLAVFLGGLWSRRHYFTGPATQTSAHSPAMTLKFAVPASLSTLGLLLLAYIDLPIVRAVSTPEASGLYAAASTLAKISLLLPQALVGIIFPEAARLTRLDKTASRARLGLILSALAFTFLVSGAASLAMMALPEFLMRVLAGQAYSDGADILRVLAPAMMFLAASTLIITYAIARGAYSLLIPMALAIALLAILPFQLALNPLQIAYVVLAILIGLTIACLAWLFVTHRPQVFEPSGA